MHKEEEGFYSEFACAYSNLCILHQQSWSGMSNANVAWRLGI